MRVCVLFYPGHEPPFSMWFLNMCVCVNIVCEIYEAINRHEESIGKVVLLVTGYVKRARNSASPTNEDQHTIN